MPLLYDATFKELFEQGPEDWLAFLGFDFSSVEAVDADLSAITADADKVYVVDGEEERWILHLEAQSSRNKRLPRRTHLYNTLIEDRHDLLVQSVILLLRSEADSPSLTGVYRRAFRGEEPHLVFKYRVVRIWEVPVETILAGGLATLPLAALAETNETRLPTVIDKIKQRLQDAATETQSALWGATYVLLGLRWPEEFIVDLLQGVKGMKESTTYQAILREGRAEGEAKGRAEGRAEEAKQIIVLQGETKFGPLDEANRAFLDAIDDIETLQRISLRILVANDWTDLLKPNGGASQN